MKYILGFLLLIYLFAVSPFLLGCLWNRMMRRKEKSSSAAFAYGFCILFALFFGLAMLTFWRNLTLDQMGIAWLLMTGLLNICSVICNKSSLLEYAKATAEFWKTGSRLQYITGILALGAMLVSVFLLMPESDITVQTVALTVDTGTYYAYQEYTGELYSVPQTDRKLAPLELLYSVAANLTGFQPVVLIQWLLPVFLLLFFYCCYWQVGTVLFREKKEQQSMFFLLVLLIAYVPVYTTNMSVSAAIFRNSWNGAALLNYCLLPLGFCQGLKLLSYIQYPKGERKKTERNGLILEMAGIVAASQLLNVRGGFYQLLILVIFALTAMVWRVCEHVGIMDRD